jgi:hypothetical protein
MPGYRTIYFVGGPGLKRSTRLRTESIIANLCQHRSRTSVFEHLKDSRINPTLPPRQLKHPTAPQRQLKLQFPRNEHLDLMNSGFMD